MTNLLKRIWRLFVKPGPGELRRRSEAPPLRIELRPSARAVDHEQRHDRRYDFGGRAHVLFNDMRTYSDCVVLDASRTGARVVVPHDVALKPLQGISIFFQGYTLRSRVRVAWQRATDAGLEMGLAFRLADRDVPLLDKFAQFLTWRASCRVA